MSFSQIYSDIWTRKISARSLSSIYRTLGLVYSLHPLIWYVKFDFTSMLCWPTRVWFGIIIIGNLCVAPWVDIYIPFVFPPVRQTRPVRWLCLTRAALEFNKKNSIELINLLVPLPTCKGGLQTKYNPFSTKGRGKFFIHVELHQRSKVDR